MLTTHSANRRARSKEAQSILLEVYKAFLFAINNLNSHIDVSTEQSRLVCSDFIVESDFERTEDHLSYNTFSCNPQDLKNFSTASHFKYSGIVIDSLILAGYKLTRINHLILNSNEKTYTRLVPSFHAGESFLKKGLTVRSYMAKVNDLLEELGL